MTQIEPLSMITTSMMVKISASMFQPPSARVFMCRKKIMCTTICTAASARTTIAVVDDRSNTLPMTSQNGTAVSSTANRNPVA